MADGQDEPAGKRTETTVREYAEDGKLTKQTTTTVVQVSVDDEKPWPGQYL